MGTPMEGMISPKGTLFEFPCPHHPYQGAPRGCCASGTNFKETANRSCTALCVERFLSMLRFDSGGIKCFSVLRKCRNQQKWYSMIRVWIQKSLTFRCKRERLFQCHRFAFFLCCCKFRLAQRRAYDLLVCLYLYAVSWPPSTACRLQR